MVMCVSNFKSVIKYFLKFTKNTLLTNKVFFYHQQILTAVAVVLEYNSDFQQNYFF